MKLGNLLVLLALCGAAESGMAQTLEVELDGVQHARGMVRVALYKSAETFRKQALQVREVAARPGTVSVSFDDLEPGRYAVMAFHDEDDNGKLNLRLGMFPAEGYGLSNNPTVMGPPAFEDSAFELTTAAPRHLLVMQVRY